MKTYSILRHIWRAAYPLLIIWGMEIAAILIILIVWVIGMIIGGVTSSSPEYADLSQKISQWLTNNPAFLTLITYMLCLAPFLPIWLKTRKEAVCYEKPKAAPVLIFSFLAFAGFNMCLGLLLTVTDITRFFPSYQHIVEAMTSGNVIFRFLAAVIAAPIIEEMCFRGIILNRLLTWTRTWVAVLVQAALFSVFHLNLLQGLYVFILAIWQGWLYIRFRKLWPCIVGHMAFNLVSFIVGAVESKGVAVPIWALIPGVALFVIGGYLLMKQPAVLPVTSGAVLYGGTKEIRE